MNDHIRIPVTRTGAVAGSETLQTGAFQRAIDDVFLAGGGIVEVPAGKFRIGGVRLRSGVTLYLRSGAELYGSREPEDYRIPETDALEPLRAEYRTEKPWEPFRKEVQRDYSFMLPGGRWNRALIYAADAENIAVIGEQDSVIDGSDCFDELGEERYRGPHGIGIHHCKNVLFSGYTIRNTGNWAHCVFYSENIRCENVTVLAGHDGIHLTRCDNILVKNCGFYTGDDCVAGFGNRNVVVEDCVLNTACSGMRFGGTNVLVHDCRFYGPAEYFFRGSLTPEEKRSGAKPSGVRADGTRVRTNMLSMFTYYADFSVDIPEQPGNIVIRDCTASNVDRFLHFNYSGNERWQANRPLRSLLLENIVANGVILPVTAYGSADVPLSLTLRNVSISFAPGYEDMPAFWIANCERILLDHVSVKNRPRAPLFRTWSPSPNITSVSVASDTIPGADIEFTSDPFVCKAI